MAGVLRLLLLLHLHHGSFVLASAEPADDAAAPGSARGLGAALNTTVSLLSTGETASAPNTTDAPTTGFAAGYGKSTTKAPETTTTAQHLPEERDETAGREVPRKKAEEEEEGPLELGEWNIFISCSIFCIFISLCLTFKGKKNLL